MSALFAADEQPSLDALPAAGWPAQARASALQTALIVMCTSRYAEAGSVDSGVGYCCSHGKAAVSCRHS
jgi:hypothetical protein